MAAKQVFVTVGTTKFDSLINAVLQDDVLNILRQQGYTRLLLQIGHGHIDQSALNTSRLSVEYYRLKDSLVADIAAANLIISHAGAGSCLEAMEAKKPLIVVINEDLMNNHQAELAEALAARGHVYACTPSTLLTTLKESDLSVLKHFPSPDSNAFMNFLNSVMENTLL